MVMGVQRIHSQARPGLLLHMVIRPGDVRPEGFERTNVCSNEDRLQLALLELPTDKTFAPHLHVESDEPIARGRAQESWVVIRGSVEFIFFDLDGTRIGSQNLYPGDVSVSLAGGHTYRSLEPGTLVYEYKSGPYMGQEQDKAPIVDGIVELLPGQRTALLP